MNVIIWARVSSREQREGYSIDAQLRACREFAKKHGWNVVREFSVAESARRGADRAAFNEMFQWVRKNASRQKIEVVLSHKLDRVCRNMRDAVRMQELEDERGVKLSFVENQFGPGAAGALSFNVMAAVAQYYSDNLRSEVLKGLDERVRQGWHPGLAPFGYENFGRDRTTPVLPHPENSQAVIRMFELFSTGDYTFKSLGSQLAEEGYTFRKSQPRFHRSALSYLLNNRFYIGDVKRRDEYFPGRHQPLVDRMTFERCQDILLGRNRRTGSPSHAYAGGLFHCAYCGSLITGEKIRRKLKGGGVRVHQYYRCANNDRTEDHPQVRWKETDLEESVISELSRLQIADAELRDWFREALTAAFSDLTIHEAQQRKQLKKRQSELQTMQDRLLHAYLTGTVDEEVYRTKTTDFQREGATLEERIGKVGDTPADAGEMAVKLFDWTQNADEFWSRSKIPIRREILSAVSLNRTLSDVSLIIEKRKPFDILAEGPFLKQSRGDMI